MTLTPAPFDPGPGWIKIEDRHEHPERERLYLWLGTTLTMWVRGEEPEQTEFWAVYGGQGGRRIAQNLPSREAAEKVKRDFDHRLRDYPMPYTTIERQDGRYGQ